MKTLTATNRYHEIQLQMSGREDYLGPAKEIVTLRFVTTWRGRTVEVEMTANRYRHGGYKWEDKVTPVVWSEWRIYATNAREEGYKYGTDLTATAKSRLSDQLRGDVEAWLESDAYAESERKAYLYACRRMANDMGGDSKRFRMAVHKNAGKLGQDAGIDIYVKMLVAVADAYDVYQSALSKVTGY